MGKEEVKGVEGREIIIRVHCIKIIIFSKREKKKLVAVVLRNQWIKCLLLKHENLNSDHQNSHREPGTKVEKGGSLRFAGQSI